MKSSGASPSLMSVSSAIRSGSMGRDCISALRCSRVPFSHFLVLIGGRSGLNARATYEPRVAFCL